MHSLSIGNVDLDRSQAAGSHPLISCCSRRDECLHRSCHEGFPPPAWVQGLHRQCRRGRLRSRGLHHGGRCRGLRSGDTVCGRLRTAAGGRAERHTMLVGQRQAQRRVDDLSFFISRSPLCSLWSGRRCSDFFDQPDAKPLRKAASVTGSRK